MTSAMAARGKKISDETTTSRESASKILEQRYVYGVYQQMSGYFRHQHYNVWPNVEQFLTSLPLGSLVADIGCGNGKYLGVNTGAFTLGADICAELVEIAGSRVGNEVLTCDNLSLPYRDNAFDAVISIGVVHHFTSAKRRQQAVKELCRVLRPGGKLMICVWAFEQRHRKFGSQDVLIPWCNNDGRIPVDERDGSDRCRADDNRFLAKKFSSTVVDKDSNSLNNHPKPQPRDIGTALNLNGADESKINKMDNGFNRRTNGEENSVEENSVGSILQSASNVVLSLVHKRVSWLLSDTIKHRDLNGIRDAKKVPGQSVEVAGEEVFAVREFPQSSCPKKVAKQLSLDTASLGNTKYSLYMDSHGSNDTSLAHGFERTTEVFSAFEQQVMRSKNSHDPSRQVSASHQTVEVSANCTAQLDNASSKTRLNGHQKNTNSDLTFDTSNNLNNRPKNTSHQNLSNVSFKQFKVSYHNRMIKQPVPTYVEEVNGDTQQDHKVTSSSREYISSRHAQRVRTLSGSQTVLRDSSGDHKVDFSCAFTARDKPPPPPLQRLTRKLSTSAIVDTNASHANISCDSEIFLSKMLRNRNDSGNAEVRTHPKDDHDYLNRDSCLRFYHVFSDGELVELIRQHVPQLRVVDARYEHANWCVVAQKIFQPPTIKRHSKS